MTELKKIELSEENLELVSGGVNFKEILKKIDFEVVSAVISTAALIAGSFVVYKKRDKIKNWFKKDNSSSNDYDYAYSAETYRYENNFDPNNP